MFSGNSKSIRKQLKAVAEDLFNLEINTIIKPAITGRKMPVPRVALAEIGEKFQTRLKTMVLPESVKVGSRSSFTLIKAHAIEERKRIKAEEEGDETEREAGLLMLLRIERACDQILKKIFIPLEKGGVKNLENTYGSRGELETGDTLPLETNQLILIRKIWEIGVEEIAMQTIIQMDGDVVTYIPSKYAGSEYQSLHNLHHEGVHISIGFWRELIEILTGFLGKLLRLILPK